MKKLLALCLIAALFSFPAVNASNKPETAISDSEFEKVKPMDKTDKASSRFSDVDVSSGYAAEITALSDSGIIQGAANGQFRPNDEITRAEFAAVLCRAIGAEEKAESAGVANKNYFTDVPADYWAAGYINTAYEYGAINGIGNGEFAPQSPVTNEQAIKMLIAAWGYTGEAEELGGYPNGYMEVAYRNGVLDTVSFNYGNASKRWVVSMFVYGVLEKFPVSQSAVAENSPPIKPQSSVTPVEIKKEKLSENTVIDPVAALKKNNAEKREI
jgi:hypothetical protein